MSADRESFLIIANPTSGRGRGRRLAERVAAGLKAQHASTQLAWTSGAGDATRRARDAAAEGRWSCIVACGGDGTVQEIAAALARSRGTGRTPHLGLAPAGRCNDFVRALGVPRDIPGIVAALINPNATAVDLGRVNDRFFCTVATVGIDAEVSSYVDVMRMPLRGTPAYIYGALRVLAGYKAPLLRLEGEFGVIERELLMASTANTCSYGGNIRVVPHASPTDGRLDLCTVDPMPRLRAARLIPKLMAGKHTTRPEVHFEQVRRMTITSSRLLEIWADGERVGQTPAVVEVAAGAVSVRCPQLAKQ